MTWTQSRDVSLIATRFFMKIIGFWLTNNRGEQRWKKFALIYTLILVSFTMFVLLIDICYSYRDFNQAVYTMCNVFTVSLIMCKILVLLVHRRKYFDLLRYTQENFWRSNYDSYENNLLNKCKNTCTFLICVFSFFAQGTALNYVTVAIVENIGKDELERVLPYNMHFLMPTYKTPYFEIIFVSQIAILVHMGVCYLCVDNFLCVINLHLAYQFRILQYRFECIQKIVSTNKKNNCSNKSLSYRASESYGAFKDCIKQHQTLIEFCNTLEEIFTMIVLFQVVLFSLLICLDGYLITLQDAPILQRLGFTFHILGCMCQLLMFTYSCDCLIQESTKVASSVYSIRWSVLPMTKDGRMLRKDMGLVILRSGVPCRLTANGFFTVSLETYTSVLSTAVSYFTLLRQY